MLLTKIKEIRNGRMIVKDSKVKDGVKERINYKGWMIVVYDDGDVLLTDPYNNSVGWPEYNSVEKAKRDIDKSMKEGLYASKNKGTISGVDSKTKDEMGKCKSCGEYKHIDSVGICDRCRKDFYVEGYDDSKTKDDMYDYKGFNIENTPDGKFKVWWLRGENGKELIGTTGSLQEAYSLVDRHLNDTKDSKAKDVIDPTQPKNIAAAKSLSVAQGKAATGDKKSKDAETAETYEQVGKQVGLTGRLQSGFVEYMKKRWDYNEGMQVASGYAREWARRFQNGTAFAYSDLEGQRILKGMGFGANDSKTKDGSRSEEAGDKKMKDADDWSGELSDISHDLFRLANKLSRIAGSSIASPEIKDVCKKSESLLDEARHLLFKVR